MIKPIRTLIWEWYGAGEKSKIESIFELGNVLRQLALTPEEKSETIPGCAYCELTNQYFGRGSCFLLVCTDDVDIELIQKIKDLSCVLESLSLEETICFSNSIFSLPGWLKAQALSSQALKLMNWNEIQAYEKELS